MARILAPLAGASLLALALPAAAQQHDHHPAPAPQQQPPAADPHAGHDMSGMDHSGPDMPQMDHAAHAMTGALGPWPMTREASGTAWQPDASQHGGLHSQWGDWTFMSHLQLNLVHDWQNGPRGDEKTFVSGMVMTSARRDFSDGSTLNLRAMLSPDPFMGKEGFPLLLAAGETADGVTPPG